MTATHNEHRALKRLLAVDWTPNEGRQKSHVALMDEYLRRSALWAKRLHVTEHWPFFDLASFIASEVRADQGEIGQLEGALRPIHLWPTIKKTCIWFLHWDAVRRERAQPVAEYNLPAPFEPLIRLYERGGHFDTEHGFINVGGAGIPAKIRGWQAYDSSTPLVALDEDALNELDAAANLPPIEAAAPVSSPGANAHPS